MRAMTSPSADSQVEQNPEYWSSQACQYILSFPFLLETLWNSPKPSSCDREVFCHRLTIGATRG